MLLILAIVLLLVLPSPWNLLGFLASLVVFAGEIAFWNRTVRHRRPAAGAETMIGKTGTTVTSCRPRGQIRIAGEIWECRCREGADPGETVVVTGREDLILVVEHATQP